MVRSLKGTNQTEIMEIPSEIPNKVIFGYFFSIKILKIKVLFRKRIFFKLNLNKFTKKNRGVSLSP